MIAGVRSSLIAHASEVETISQAKLPTGTTPMIESMCQDIVRCCMPIEPARCLRCSCCAGCSYTKFFPTEDSTKRVHPRLQSAVKHFTKNAAAKNIDLTYAKSLEKKEEFSNELQVAHTHITRCVCHGSQCLTHKVVCCNTKIH